MELGEGPEPEPTQTEDGRWMCPELECNHAYQSKGGCTRHWKEKHRVNCKPWVCDDCGDGERFTRPYYLADHQRRSRCRRNRASRPRSHDARSEASSSSRAGIGLLPNTLLSFDPQSSRGVSALVPVTEPAIALPSTAIQANTREGQVQAHRRSRTGVQVAGHPVPRALRVGNSDADASEFNQQHCISLNEGFSLSRPTHDLRCSNPANVRFWPGHYRDGQQSHLASLESVTSETGISHDDDNSFIFLEDTDGTSYKSFLQTSALDPNATMSYKKTAKQDSSGDPNNYKQTGYQSRYGGPATNDDPSLKDLIDMNRIDLKTVEPRRPHTFSQQSTEQYENMFPAYSNWSNETPVQSREVSAPLQNTTLSELSLDLLHQNADVSSFDRLMNEIWLYDPDKLNSAKRLLDWKEANPDISGDLTRMWTHILCLSQDQQSTFRNAVSFVLLHKTNPMLESEYHHAGGS